MHKPIVSIVMATWNRADIIGQAIQSVLNQSFNDWELIIVSDGSSDNTDEIITQWQNKDSRIRYTSIHHTGKIAVVSNVGLKMALGEFIAILDDDDWWIDSKKLEKQIAFLRDHPDCVVCGSGFVVVDAKGKELERVLKPETDSAIRGVALFANPIANPSSMFRRLIGGYYDESLQLADWDFWLALGTKGKCYNFPQYFLAYRMWDQGISFKEQPILARAAIRIVCKHKGQYPGFFKAFFLACLYWCYTRLPFSFRKRMNVSLSRTKKRTFSRS